jgi:predicted amidohydrolase YtcJ
MMKRINNMLLIAIFCYSSLSAFQLSIREDDSSQAILYYGGDIITMEGIDPRYVEALVTKNGIIEFAGDKKDALNQYQDARIINLEGRTLLPGFIDGHMHFASLSALSIGASIMALPDGPCGDIPCVVNVLKEWAVPENIELTGWIFGIGFDDSLLSEGRFPNRDDLDQVSKEHPVMIVHVSGHFASVNSKGLEIMGFDKQSPDPEGGVIRRIQGTTIPNGVLEEMAAIPHVLNFLKPKSTSASKKFFYAAQRLALANGITTAQEGRAMLNSHNFLSEVARADLLLLDVVSYLDYTISDSLHVSSWYSKEYKNRYRIGGVKITLDGSPQGRTAWRTQPYLIPPEGRSDDYAGYPAFADENQVREFYEKAFHHGWQVLTHANGDAAIDQMISAMLPAAHNYQREDFRNVLIHGQYVRNDQLDDIGDLGIVVSLFPLHTFYWGDWHEELIGDTLAAGISPTRTALRKGLKITTHTDAPIVNPNIMRAIWAASVRETRSGKILGAEERLTPYQALCSVTSWSAYQHFEEDKKGTLSPGKLADLVILNNNPLKVPLDRIKDIVVHETIKEGITVYSSEKGDIGN